MRKEDTLENTIIAEQANDKLRPVCGIVMPISAIDGCNESHWADVMYILTSCIERAGFEANIVSNADDIGVIQKRIVQNLYDNPIVICDVSGKNPNVMFELGLRLAFDKPTIIVKDEKTSYSFDTSPIEHLEYPRDLRYNKIEDFKIKLIDKIKKTYKKSQEDPQFSTFLKHFGEFKVAKIDQKEVSQQEFIMDEIKSLRRLILQTNRQSSSQRELIDKDKDNNVINICCRNHSISKIEEVLPLISSINGVLDVSLKELRGKHFHVIITIEDYVDKYSIRSKINRLLKNTETNQIDLETDTH